MTFQYADYITHNEAIEMGSIIATEELRRVLEMECDGELYELREATIRNLSDAIDKLADMQATLDRINEEHNLQAVFERTWKAKAGM